MPRRGPRAVDSRRLRPRIARRERHTFSFVTQTPHTALRALFTHDPRLPPATHPCSQKSAPYAHARNARVSVLLRCGAAAALARRRRHRLLQLGHGLVGGLFALPRRLEHRLRLLLALRGELGLLLGEGGFALPLLGLGGAPLEQLCDESAALTRSSCASVILACSRVRSASSRLALASCSSAACTRRAAVSTCTSAQRTSLAVVEARPSAAAGAAGSSSSSSGGCGCRRCRRHRAVTAVVRSVRFPVMGVRLRARALAVCAGEYSARGRAAHSASVIDDSCGLLPHIPTRRAGGAAAPP